MNPVHHARSSAAKHGGEWRDYVAFHTWFDQSKAAIARTAHRAFLHTDDLGRALARRAFGDHIHLTGGTIKVDTLIDQHLREDLGFRVRLDDWLAHIPETPESHSTTFRGSSLRVTRSVPPSKREFVSRWIECPAEAAAGLWGGTKTDYDPIVEVLEMGEAHSKHPMARSILHNALGIFIAEQIVGPAIETKNGKIVPTRLVAEQIVQARCHQHIPGPAEVMARLKTTDGWMRSHLVRASKEIWPEAAEEHDHDHDHDAEASLHSDPEHPGLVDAHYPIRSTATREVFLRSDIFRAVKAGCQAAGGHMPGEFDLRPGDTVILRSGRMNGDGMIETTSSDSITTTLVAARADGDSISGITPIDILVR